MDDGEGKDESGSDVESQSNENWWERLPDDYFEFVGERGDGKNVTVKCKLCRPKAKLLSTAKNSHSNLKKHVQVSVMHLN